MAKVKTKPPVDPFLKKAQGVVDAEIDPQRLEIQKAIAAAEAARANGARANAAIITAVGKMSADDPQILRDTYRQAADDTAGYAKGFTGALRADSLAAADQNSALIKTLGAPGGAVQSGGDAAANVAYATGGAIPAGTMAERAATILAAEMGHREAAGLRLGDQASALDWKAQGDIKGIRDQLLALEAKRPGLLQTALASLHQQANAQRATETQVGYLQLQQAKTLEDQAIALTNLSGTMHIVVGTGANRHVVDTGKPALGSTAASVQQRQAQADADRNARLKIAQQADQTRRDIAAAANQAKIDAAKAAASAKAAAAQVAAQRAQNKPPTPAQKATIIKGADTSGNAIVTSKIQQYYANTPNLAPQQKGESLDDYAKRHAKGVQEFNEKKRYNYPMIVKTVEQTIAPQLQVLGWTPAQIHQHAVAIVQAQINAGK